MIGLLQKLLISQLLFMGMVSGGQWLGVIRNPSFVEGELGQVSHWNTVVASPQARMEWSQFGRNDEYSFLIENLQPGRGGFIEQQITVQPGKLYSLVVWYRAFNVAPGPIVEIFGPEGALLLNQSYKLEASNHVWNRFICQFRPAKDNILIRVSLRDYPQKVWLDDLNLYSGEVPIENFSFEDYEKNLPRTWETVVEAGNPKFSLSYGGFTGERAGTITASGGKPEPTSGWYRTKITDHLPGSFYRIRGWYKTFGLNSDAEVLVRVRFLDSNMQKLEQTSDFIYYFPPTGDWSEFNKSIYVPKSTAALYLDLCLKADKGTVYWDQLSLEGGD